MMDKWESKECESFPTERENVADQNRGSGGERDKKTGRWVQKEDHHWANAYMKAVKGSWDKGIPFLLCSTSQCVDLPVIIPGKYDQSFVDISVVTFMWMEKTGSDKYLLKMKYERLDISKPSLFERPINPPPKIALEDQENLVKANVETCKTCKRTSPQLYKKKWICLWIRKAAIGKCTDEDDCPNAMAGQKDLSDGDKIDFDPRFLADRARREASGMREWKAPTPAEDFAALTNIEKGRISLQDFNIGTTCVRCNCGIQRVDLSGWACGNKDCEGYEVKCPLPAIPKRSLIGRSNMLPLDVPALGVKIAHEESVNRLPPFTHTGYRIYPLQLWNFLEDAWSETVYIARPYAATLSSDPNGADKVLKSVLDHIEGDRISLRRRPLKKSFVKGQHTGYFSLQAGEEYDYSAAHPADALADIPDDIGQRKDFLAGLMQAFTKEDDFVSNQIMLNIYLPGDDIGQHGDQNTRGHIVSESLGANRTFYLGYNKKGYFQTDKLDRPGSGSPDEIPKGTLAYSRYEAWNANDKGKSWETFKAGLKKSIENATVRGVSPLIEIEQTHGSFVTMSSDPFQQHFVHWAATDPERGPRLNITVRHIPRGQKHGDFAKEAAAGRSTGAKEASSNASRENRGSRKRKHHLIVTSSDEDE